MIEWIGNQFHRMVTAHKEKLPSRSRKFKYPTFLWLTPSSHYALGDMNEYRKKCGDCMNRVTSLFREMETLQIDWDELDMNLYTKGQLSAKGKVQYWSAVNKAFENWDRDQMRQLHNQTPGSKPEYSCSIPNNFNKKKRRGNHRERPEVNDKFTWKTNQTKFKLPKPF